MEHLVYLSLGSNIGDRAAHLRRALEQLATLGRLVSISSFYETEPVELTDQSWFLNCSAALETLLAPSELMSRLLAIEQSMGRRRVQKKGPRIIDLDILLYGDDVVNTSEVTIPHPAMAHRRFVLAPLAEIAPEARHPVLRKTMRELLEELPSGQAARKVDED